MTTQVFRGRTLDEARKAACEVLGKDAVVLTARHRRRSGIAGLLGGVDCEIAAAIASSEVTTPTPPSSHASRGPFAASAYTASERDGREASDDPIASLRTELRAELRAVKIGQSRPAPAASADIGQEFAAIRELLDELTPPAPRGDKATKLVRSLGIEGAAAVALSRIMRTRKEEGVSLAERLRNAVSELVRVCPWPLATPGRAVISVVGPTGGGKTTTLAKLAARAKFDGKTATLVSCDIFRVGGVEHLERYADLLGMPAAVARDASELAKVLAEARTDLVLVDTSGREPVVDSAERLLSAAAFGADPSCRGFARHVLMCVPASIRAVDARRVVKAFWTASPTAVAITKLDDTDTPSGVVHAAFLSKLPIAVLCAGPRVPEDIAPATMGAVLDAVMRPITRGIST